jgi:hypothetical protein
MQKLHRLSQPTEMDTHAEYGDSRLVGRSDGNVCNASTISICASWLCRARSSSTGRLARSCVPDATSTHVARERTGAAFWREAAPDRDLHVRSPLFDRIQLPQVAVEPIVGVLAHRTGVENDDVRTVRHVSGRALVSGLLKQAG